MNSIHKTMCIIWLIVLLGFTLGLVGSAFGETKSECMNRLVTTGEGSRSDCQQLNRVYYTCSYAYDNEGNRFEHDAGCNSTPSYRDYVNYYAPISPYDSLYIYIDNLLLRDLFNYATPGYWSCNVYWC